MPNRTFLTARWENLLMANYPVDPDILKPYLPHRTELDFWQGKCYVSLVGFLFLDTKVLGAAIPFHRNFEEFNLRFYVRHRAEEGWRRGVVFIKEVVPRRAIVLVANALYGEHYVRLPMDHDIRRGAESLDVEYRWRHRRRWNLIRAEAAAQGELLDPDSEGAFITEHYWGYTRIDDRRTTTYQVEHPSWRVHPVRDYEIDVDVEGLYGPAFAEYLDRPPSSIFLAEGSEVTVRRGMNL